MLAKKLLLASIGVMFINTGVYGEEWGRVKCLRECTNASCMDATKQNECQTNCAQSLDSIDACMKAKPQGSSQGLKATPATPPRRALPPAPQSSSMQPEVEVPGGQALSDKPHLQRRRGMAFSNPPLGQQPSTVETNQSSGLHQSNGADQLKKQRSGSKSPQRPHQPLPTLPSQFTYTADEVNHLLKGLLNDQIKEVTTGCDSAIGRVNGGIKMVEADKSAEAIDLINRGKGFITLFSKEKEDAASWVKAFDISKNLSEEDLKKYGIDNIDHKEKLSLEVLKKIYQKSQEKSLLVAQDCKVKSAQFQGWLEVHLAKQGSGDENSKKKAGFFRRGESKK